MLFNSLYFASLASAACYIPFLSDPKISFGTIQPIETNKPFTLPISMKYDAETLRIKKKNFIDSIVIGPDRVNVQVDLVDGNNNLIRTIYGTEIESYNGVFANDTQLVIPSYGLGNLPRDAKLQVTLNNFDRLFVCNKATAVSGPLQVKNGTGESIYTDDFFLNAPFRFPAEGDTITLNQWGCGFMQFSSGGGRSYSRCTE